MSGRQSIALTLSVGLVTVTGLWMLVLVAVPISGAFSLMAEKRRHEAAAKPERDAGQRVDAILAEVLDRMAKGHSINRLDKLLPWKWRREPVILAA
jgi:hypothetical protein